MLNIFFWFFVGVFLVGVGSGIYKLCRHEDALIPVVIFNLGNIGVQICNLINNLSK